jgi:hypothetical protein
MDGRVTSMVGASSNLPLSVPVSLWAQTFGCLKRGKMATTGEAALRETVLRAVTAALGTVVENLPEVTAGASTVSG